MAERVEDMLQRLGMNFQKLTEGVEEMQAASRSKAQSTVGIAPTTSADDLHESNESECGKVKDAIAEAVRLGVVREELMGERRSRDAYVLSSSHFGNNAVDPTIIPQDTKLSQVQLFQLMHLFHRRGCTSPVFVEGKCYRMGYDDRFGDMLRAEGTDLSDNRVQQHLYDHPDTLIALLDRHVACRKHDPTLTAPAFYHFTAYPAIAGAHSPETEAMMQPMVKWTEWSLQLAEKYRPFVGQFVDPDRKQREASVQTGWQDGRALLCLAGIWMHADEVARDCANYLKYVDMLEEFDVRRERELSDLMHATKIEFSPLCFVGLGHTLRMVEHLKDAFAVHILTPHSSTRLDKKRSAEPVNSPKNPLMNVDLYRKLLYLAQNVPPIRH